jgi:flagellar biogenesis protein FliO
VESNLWEAWIRIIVCLPFVGLLAYLLIKFGVARNYCRTKGNLRLLEQVVLQPKSTLNIVRVGEEYLLFSATEKEIVLIKKLENYRESEAPDFQYYLKNSINRFHRGSDRNG